MRLKQIEISGFKSFAKKSNLTFNTPVTAVVGPNGSGKSNVVEAFRFVLGEQSIKSMRGKLGSDLIFKGSNNTSKLSRAVVSILFDNSDKIFSFPISEGFFENTNSKVPALFDTIEFTREIFADGTSKYLLNGTEIRLKQMNELLSSVNIGSSGHHIISQGEADGILRANHKERREILEDALGLKIYHFRIKETENKLNKSLETLKDVNSLRKELAPHLSFLKKQVDKIEKGKVYRDELEGLMLKYLSIEKYLFKKEEIRSNDILNFTKNKKRDLEEKLKNIPENQSIIDETLEERISIKNKLSTLSLDRRAFESKIGRLEGMIEIHRKMIFNQKDNQIKDSITFGFDDYKKIVSDLEIFISELNNFNSLENLDYMVKNINDILLKIKSYNLQTENNDFHQNKESNNEIKQTAIELENIQQDMSLLLEKENQLLEKLEILEKQREELFNSSQKMTINRYEIIGELKICESEIQIVEASKRSFMDRKEYFESDLKEAGFLFGVSFIHKLQNIVVEDSTVSVTNIHDLKRSIDRLKIRLDEHSGIGNDVLSEYESTFERDVFLAKEVEDIQKSISNLEILLVDLKKILDEKFNKGVEVINQRFGEFFKTMFGGGSAFLSITMEKRRKRKKDTDISSDEDIDDGDLVEEENFERGIDIHVNLPEKKVKELQMLSGGERSLVSIALLFAISQVNPPPFLVLDETDAALDEANSRRYGDMVERLSEYSQLIVVTHNRETMSRANVLYGVTLGSDGASKLLSIKFDEAVKVAK